MLANPDCTLSQEKIAEAAGVPHTTFYNWLRNQEFLKEVGKLVDKYTATKLAYAWHCLIARMPVDTAAIKLYFELQGKYKQDVKLDIAGKVVIVDDIPDS